MAKTARNAACPCGSGCKYKQCCLLEEERLAKQARDDSRVGRSVSDWSVEQFGDELAEAFEEFHPESHRIGERDFALLLTWFNTDRELSRATNRTSTSAVSIVPLHSAVARRGGKAELDPDEIEERLAQGDTLPRIAADLGRYNQQSLANRKQRVKQRSLKKPRENP